MKRLTALCAHALFLATPAAAQGFNVDVGSVLGVPTPAYGAAAAQPGLWNQMNDGSGMPLVGLAGQATGASISALGANFAFWSDNPATSGDDEQLLDDACDGPCIYTLSGLAPGDYRVFTYAWAPDSAAYLTRVSVQGSSDPDQVVGGSWSGAHALGVTYAQHDVSASSGQIVIEVTVASGYATSNGLQIVELGAGGPAVFCTSKPTSLAGCTSALSTTAASISKTAGAGSCNLQALPAPGGAQPGLFLWTRSGLLSTPAATSFGFLCLSSFLRGTPTLPGGTGGQCDGTYSWDLGGFVAASGAISAGDSLWVQAWYRDPGLAVGALLTEGRGPIPITP